MDTNHALIEEALIYGHNRFQKGQLISYEGKVGRVMSVKPMFIIKVEDRVVCGALHTRVKPIGESHNHTETAKS